MSEKILVIAAHSDDEALGAAGTLRRHVCNGDEVHLWFLTNGVGARASTEDETENADQRKSATEKAAAILGAKSFNFFDFPDNRLDGVDLLDIVQAIELSTADLSPDIIYTHSSCDLNVDHRICQQAVLTAFRPVPGSTVRAIYGFEVASSTEWAFNANGSSFIPQHFVNIASTLDAKMEILNAYHEEMRDFPHARSVEGLKALAKWRGASMGLPAAEAFSVIRQTTF